MNSSTGPIEVNSGALIAGIELDLSDRGREQRKAADIIGLYLHPPQHAAVFFVDEKSAIQALHLLALSAFALAPTDADAPYISYPDRCAVSKYAGTYCGEPA